MKFSTFLKDQLDVIGLALSFLAMTALILWLTPSVHFNWETLLYIIVIASLILLGYLIIRFFKIQKWLALVEKSELTASSPLDQAPIPLTGEQAYIHSYIQQLISEQHEALETLIHNQKEQKEFIDSWVHEIKVPLASVKLLNELIEDKIQEKQFYQLENDVQKIESYVDQVLYYSRLDSFSRDYLIQEVSLKSILLPLIRQNANYFIQHNLHYAIEGPDFQVLTDQKWLSFILNQILSNCLKYTADNGQITISLSENERGTWIAITDTGIGIPLEEQRRVFDKGFTGQTGRNQSHHSTGLGLYLAKNLTTKLGHQLYLESTLHEGTTVSLLFPHLNYYTSDQEEKLI